jgi:hypothetical protein
MRSWRLPPSERRGREASSELALAVAILVALVSLALAGFGVTALKAREVEALSLASVQRIEPAIAWAVAGAFTAPRPEWLRTPPPGKFFDAGEWRDGEYVMPLKWLASERPLVDERGAPLTLAFRVAVAPASGATMWLCGRHEPPPGFQAAAPRHTSLPSELAIRACRAGIEDSP